MAAQESLHQRLPLRRRQADWGSFGLPLEGRRTGARASAASPVRTLRRVARQLVAISERVVDEWRIVVTNVEASSWSPRPPGCAHVRASASGYVVGPFDQTERSPRRRERQMVGDLTRIVVTRPTAPWPGYSKEDLEDGPTARPANIPGCGAWVSVKAGQASVRECRRGDTLLRPVNLSADVRIASRRPACRRRERLRCRRRD